MVPVSSPTYLHTAKQPYEVFGHGTSPVRSLFFLRLPETNTSSYPLAHSDPAGLLGTTVPATFRHSDVEIQETPQQWEPTDYRGGS
jgi:hypothetical protein